MYPFFTNLSNVTTLQIFEFGNLTWEEVAKLQQRGCGIILYFWQNDIKPGKCVIETIKSLSCF